jgi:hypothetical protein
MAPKRATVPQNVFGKPASALDKLTGRTKIDEPDPEIQDRNTVIPQNGDTVSETSAPSEGADRLKISFYLRPDQLDKLEEMTMAYKRNTGKRINRNELLRRIIDRIDLALLLE